MQNLHFRFDPKNTVRCFSTATLNSTATLKFYCHFSKVAVELKNCFTATFFLVAVELKNSSTATAKVNNFGRFRPLFLTKSGQIGNNT